MTVACKQRLSEYIVFCVHERSSRLVTVCSASRLSPLSRCLLRVVSFLSLRCGIKGQERLLYSTIHSK